VDFASGNVLHFDNDTLFNIERNIIGYKSAREFFVQRLAQVRALRASATESCPNLQTVLNAMVLGARR
jgi:hypothetical protein